MDYTHVHRMLWAYAAAKRHRELHSLLSLTAVSGSAPFWASVFPPHPSTLAAFPAPTDDASEAHRAAQQASSVYTALLSVLQFCTEAQNIAEAHAATTGDSQPTERPSAQQGGCGDTKATPAVVPRASIALDQFGFANAAAFAEALHSAVEIDAFVDAAATFLVMTKLRCALAGAILKSMEQAHTSALGEMSQVDTQKACDAAESLLDAEHLFILLAGAVGGDASALIAPGAAPAEDPSITRASAATAAVPRNHRTSDEIIASPSVRSSGVAAAASTQPPPPATDASDTHDAVKEGEGKKDRGGEIETDEDAPTAAEAGTTAGDAIEVTSSAPTTARTTAAVTTTSEGISGRSTLTGPSGETPVILAQVPQSHPSSGRPSDGVVLSHVTSGRPSSAPAPLFTQQGGATPLASGNSAVVSSAQTRDSAISAASAATASGVSAGGVSVSARSLFSMASVFSLSTSGSCVDAALAVLRALQDPTSHGAATIDLATLADELLAGVRPTADSSTASDQQDAVSLSAGNLTTQSTTQSTNSDVVGAAAGNACPAVADGKRGRDEDEPRRPDEGVPPRPSESAGPRLSSDVGSPLGRASVVTTTSTVLGSDPNGRHSGRRSGRRSRRTKGSGIVVTEFLFDKALRETKAALRRRVTALLMTLLPTESLPPCCTPPQQLPRGEEVSSTLQQGGMTSQAQVNGTPTGVSGRVSVNEETKANGGDPPNVVDIDKPEDAPANVADAVRRSSVGVGKDASSDAGGAGRATQVSVGSSGASPSPFAPFTASQLSAASQAVRSQNSAVDGRGSARGFDPAALFTQLSSVSTQKSTQKSTSAGAGPQHHFVASSSRDSHLSSPSQRPTSTNHGEAAGHGILLSLPTAPAAGGGSEESMPAPSPHRPSQTAARGTPPRQGVASSSTPDRGPVDLSAGPKFSPDGQTQQRSPGIAPPSLQTPVGATTTTDLAAVVKAAGLEPLAQRGSRRVEDEDNAVGAGDLVALTQGSAAAVAALEELQMLRAAGEEALGGNVEVGMSQEAMAREQVHASSSDNTASGLETAAPAAAAVAPQAQLETQRLPQSDSKQPVASYAPPPAASSAAMDATQALHDQTNQVVDEEGPTGELPGDEVVVGEEITGDKSPERATQQRITVSSTDATPLETPNVKAIRQRFRDAAALAAVVSSKPFDEDSQPPLEQVLDTTTTMNSHATKNHPPGPSADTDRHRNSLGFAQFELWPSSDHAASSATTTTPPVHHAPPTSTAPRGAATALAPAGTAAAQPQPQGRQQFVNHPHAAAMSVRAYAPIPAAPTATSDTTGAVAGNGKKPKPPAVQEGPVLGNNKPLDTGAISRLAATWAEAAGDIPAAAQPASPAVLRAAIAQSRGHFSGDASSAASSARASARRSAGMDLPSTPATPISTEAAAALHNIGVALQRRHIPVSSGAQSAAMPIAEVMGAVRPPTARRSLSVPVASDPHLAPHPKLPLSTGPSVAEVAPESARSTPRVAVAFTAADVAAAVQRADVTAAPGASPTGKRSSIGQARGDAPPVHVDEDVGAPAAVSADPSDPVTAFFSNIAARPAARGGIPAVQRTDDFDSIETPLFSQSSQPDGAARPKGKKQPRVHATLTTTTTPVDPTHPNTASTNGPIAASTVVGAGRRAEDTVDAGGAAMRNLAAIAARHRRIAQEMAAAQQSSSHGPGLMQDTPQDAGRAPRVVGDNVDEDDTLFGQASSRPASAAPASAAAGAGSAGTIPGRRRHAFTEAEDRALIEGVARFTGPSRMTQIYNYYLAKGNVWHPARTPQQLSDHWRQVVRKRTRDIGSVDSGVVGRARAMCEEDIQFTQ